MKTNILLLAALSVCSVFGAFETDALKPFKTYRPLPEWLQNEKRGFQACPSMTASPKGLLWATWFVSAGSEDDDNALIVATSADGGATWSKPIFAIDCPGPLRVIDPGFWTDPDGNVWLFWGQGYSFWDGRAGLWASKAVNPEDPNTEWTPPRRLCDGYMKNKPTVLSNGDWLFCVEFMPYERPVFGDMFHLRDYDGAFTHAELGGTERVMSVYRSRDKGQTLTFLGKAELEKKHRTYPENMIVERKDGSLLMWGRTKYGLGRSTSTDGGRTWTPMKPFDVKNPAARFLLRRLKSGAILLVKNGPLTLPPNPPRDRIMVFVSDDDGVTWKGGLLLDARLYTSYPDLAETPDGFLHIIHDTDRRKQREIIVHRFTEADVRAGKIVTPGSRLLVTVNKSGTDTPVVNRVVQPSLFTPLKPGAVKPEGWLHEQLRLQAEGLTGHAEELYDDIGNSTWLTHQKGKNSQYDWERGPYYARGLLPLAWELDDENLKSKAKRWVEALFTWQLENGDIGPRRENWWANMLALTIIRDWYFISGEQRCLDYITKYAKFQLEALKTSPLMRDFGDRKGSPPWASARGGDEIEVLLDVYGVTKDETVLEAARLVASQTAPWTDYYHTGAPNKAYQQHIVNFNQGLKTPSLLWRLGVGDSRREKTAYNAATRKDGWAQLYAGRPDGMQNGEEPLRDREATGGTELCAQVERIVSCADQIAVFADVAAADDMESIAYNCLPATLSPDGKGLRYYLALNQPKCTNEKTDYAHNGEKVNCIVPSPHAGFGCCRSNFHIGWPKFVQSMWMKAEGGGYAAVAYGPCRLETPEVTIVEKTDYPFRDRVTLEVVKGGGTFPLYVRIPSWTKEKDAGTFRRIVRSWKPGEKVELTFASLPVVEKGWNRDAAVVRKGPLLFSWPVPHEGKVTKAFGNGFVTCELHHQSEFNVALDLRGKFEAKVVDNGRPLAAQPFDVATAPIHLKVKGCRTDEAEWGKFRPDARALMNEPPPSPIRAPKKNETLDLVPLGCTQTRITIFPWRQ